MGWFFTKAALLTFGGAYAVLPYVYQGAVEDYQWLTRDADDRRPRARREHAGAAHHGRRVRGIRRRLDARRCLGPASLLLAGASRQRRWRRSSRSCRRSCSSWPAGRSSRRTHGELKFTAPLTAITAAVVGVIVNLAVFFAWHVFWPRGFDAVADGRPRRRRARDIRRRAFALFRAKAGVIPVIAACGRPGSCSRCSSRSSGTSNGRGAGVPARAIRARLRRWSTTA